MDSFTYRNGVLYCERTSLVDLADGFGTPLYVYSRQTILDHYDRLQTAFAELDPWLCYSIKSCSNLAIIRILRERGCAFDVVSGGELARALEAGADPARIVFAGVGKTDEEIRDALNAGIGWFNVESEAEMDNVAAIAADLGRTALVALRVNPDVDPKTHVYTTTGKRETKFGVDVERARGVFRRFAGRAGLDLSAIHLHIGSQVNEIEPYVESITKGLELIDRLRSDGHTIRAINIGGGVRSALRNGAGPPGSRLRGRDHTAA